MGDCSCETCKGERTCESVFALGCGPDSVLLAVNPDYIAVKRTNQVINSNECYDPVTDHSYTLYTRIDIVKELNKESNIALGIARHNGYDQNVLFNLDNACRICISRVPDINKIDDVKDEEIWYILPKTDVVVWIN